MVVRKEENLKEENLKEENLKEENVIIKKIDKII
tara:strand:- start:144 stop:245 length:102 start_codon:yes stop_codon:yes gene_type:complete